MKKQLKYWIFAAVLLLAILFVPIPKSAARDGGSKEYTALTYKIVDWNRTVGSYKHTGARIYWFPNNFKSVDALWALEENALIKDFTATVLELQETSALVQPVADETALCDRISIGLDGLNSIGAVVGSTVRIFYVGDVMESYPAQVKAVRWELSGDQRHMEYTDQWLDKQTVNVRENNIFSHITITQIYSNCFFARPVIPSPYEIKLNGQLSGEWCVGDRVICTYENTYCDDAAQRIEADMLTIAASSWTPEPGMAYKPVIYLYPEKETAVSVKLDLSGKLTCTYPAYNNGWQVTAAPDGTLTDANGLAYNYLYWEGETNARWDMSRGFCVTGADTAAFLEDALAKLGLNRREANEFIVYWLPLMQENPYNVISFQTDAYTDAARLDVSPAPDTVIRVFMTWQATDAFQEIPPQTLTAPDRTGFTVVEWGGTKILG